MIRQVLIIVDEIVSFKHKRHYDQESKIAYQESDMGLSNPYCNYLYKLDDKTMTVSYLWARLEVEDKFEDLFYKDPLKEKYKNIIRKRHMDFYMEESDDITIDDYKSITLDFQYCNYTDMKHLPDPQKETELYNDFWNWTSV
jgi:hypothetical protein